MKPAQFVLIATTLVTLAAFGFASPATAPATLPAPEPQVFPSCMDLPANLQAKAQVAEDTFVTGLWHGRGCVMAGRLVLTPTDKATRKEGAIPLGFRPDGRLSAALFSLSWPAL